VREDTLLKQRPKERGKHCNNDELKSTLTQLLLSAGVAWLTEQAGKQVSRQLFDPTLFSPKASVQA
jgi:hypothetical protein